MARQTKAGFWIVERGEAQWLAWRDWLRLEMKRSFFPDKLPVPLEWPPETAKAAAAVAAHMAGQRTNAQKDKDWPKHRGGRAGFVPLSPEPWIRWSAFEIEERVRRFRERDNPPEATVSGVDVDRLLQSIGCVPRMAPKQRAPEAEGEATPFVMPMPAPGDDMAAIRKATIERRLRDAGHSD